MNKNETGMKSKISIRKVIHNFSYLVTGKILGDAFTFVFFVVISRTFGQEGIGQYSFAMALTGFFVVFADFGLNSLSIKEMSRFTGSISEYLGNILFLRLVFTITVFVLLFSIIPFLSFSRELIMTIAIIGTYQIINSQVDGFASVFIARQDMHFAGLIEFSLRMITAIIGIVVVKMGFGLLIALCVMPVVSMLHLVAAYSIVVKKYGRPKLVWSLTDIKQKMRDTVPYGLSAFINQLNTRLDVVFLGVIIGASASGVYNVAYRIVFLLMFVSRFMGQTLFPIASKLYVESHTKLRELYNKSLNYACLVGLPAASGLCLIAPELIELVFGPDFNESVLVMRYISWLLFIVFFRALMGVFLTSCDRQKDRTKSQWYSACLNIAGNAALIPLLGIKGAAIATLLSETFLVVLFAFRLKNILGWPNIWSRLAMGAIATAAFVSPLLIYRGLSLFVMVPLAILIYGGTLLLFNEIRRNEFRMLVSYFKSGSKKEAIIN